MGFKMRVSDRAAVTCDGRLSHRRADAIGNAHVVFVIIALRLDLLT